MIERRTFLRWGTAAPLLLVHPSVGRGEAATPQNTLVVIDDMNSVTDPDRAAIVLDAFARKGLPVSCLVDPAPLYAGPLEPGSALSQTLRIRLQKTPGLLQIVPVVKDLAGMTPYFQARAVHNALHALRDAVWGSADHSLYIAESQTIACDMMPTTMAPSGVRVSGIRNVLMRPQVSTEVRPEAWDDGVVRLVGGQRVQLQPAQKTYSFPQSRAVERVLYLSAQDFLTIPLAGLAPAASAFATQVLLQTGNHWVSPILASDLQFRDAYTYKRYIGLHFVLGRNAAPEDQAALADFQRELAAEGLPSSSGPETTSDAALGYWIPLQEGKPSPGTLDTVALFEKGRHLTSQAPADGGYGIATELTEKTGVGLNSNNILGLPTVHLQDVESAKETLERALGTTDCVLAISTELLQNQAYRRVLKNALYAIENDGISRLVSLPDYVRHLVPTGPYITHFRRTQAYQSQLSKAPVEPSAESHARLLADAKVAWSYFERWTNPKTGLCPATVNFAAGHQRLHETVTMWDVGSHIFALMAAVDLELISPKKFQSAIGRILPNIAGRRSQGRLLPQGWIATDKFKWGNRNFDGCDAGRLLAALYNLDLHPLVKERAAPTVARWDLKDIVQDGIVYSVENGVLETTFRSHCAHYAAWAFRTWGIEVKSPYEVFQGKSTPDGQMALLEVCGRIGPLGAEPLLMEALEFGMSPESAYLADVLLAAQIEEHKETGRLICVSEGPINNAPWFLYQGLQFDAQGRAWATDTVAGLDAHRTKAFRDEHLSISSKAAYLWSAYKDHPFCDRLLTVVRAKAKTSSGFASSINQRTGEPSKTYSDINTNSVILQSIAHMLKGDS
ncbi:DUF3131 domain-containing protein [Sulfitobacter sp. W074]|uniref:DUF3131 domain-containing protein n=1 Tax=Sulfitobacter sp. W074 TaxID=2867026 RepID=UPI0021A62CDC|nr:DUF3131 domain-containing protein [Sulfitobacter sp. W074]UWR39419.1 DUF3131 domain-containing protein [Sulfitobacter sp. W074]